MFRSCLLWCFARLSNPPCLSCSISHHLAPSATRLSSILWRTAVAPVTCFICLSSRCSLHPLPCFLYLPGYVIPCLQSCPEYSSCWEIQKDVEGKGEESPRLFSPVTPCSMQGHDQRDTENTRLCHCSHHSVCSRQGYFFSLISSCHVLHSSISHLLSFQLLQPFEGYLHLTIAFPTHETNGVIWISDALAYLVADAQLQRRLMYSILRPR